MTTATTEHGHDHPKHELSPCARRIYAIRDLLLEKGVITEKDIQCQIDYQEARSPANGAKLVARAWVDAAFKERFVADPKAACAEMGIDASAINEFVVLENTERVRHMVVCTLCSCYPRPILGRPPDWYKSFNYRQRSVSLYRPTRFLLGSERIETCVLAPIFYRPQAFALAKRFFLPRLQIIETL